MNVDWGVSQLETKAAVPAAQRLYLVGAGGFEPPKSSTTDLQSAPFGHSGTLPYAIVTAAVSERRWSW